MPSELGNNDQHGFLEPLPPLPGVKCHFKHLLDHRQVTGASRFAVAETSRTVLPILDRSVDPPDALRGRTDVISVGPS